MSARVGRRSGGQIASWLMMEKNELRPDLDVDNPFERRFRFINVVGRKRYLPECGGAEREANIRRMPENHSISRHPYLPRRTVEAWLLLVFDD